MSVAAVAAKKKAPRADARTVDAYDNSWTGVSSAAMEDVRRVEQGLGIQMPEELGDLLRTCNGGRPAKPFYHDKRYRREAHLGSLVPLGDLPKRRGIIAECRLQRQVHGMPDNLVPFAV